MTPTEQDNELQEKVATIVEYWDFSPLQDEDSRIERLKSEIMQLITADRKRVALEARIDELEHTFVSYDNALASELVENPEWEYGQVAERIAELKAQQEEV